MPDPTASTTPGPPLPIGRRAFLTGLGAGAGLLAARGLGVRGLGGRGAPVESASAESLLRELVASFTEGQREKIVLPADHGSRQITNTVAYLDRPHLGTLLSPAQRRLAARLYAHMVSPRGDAAFADTLMLEGKLDGNVLVVYGDPLHEPAQAVLTGGHLTLRAGDPGAQGAAFGGPMAYGQQTGNGAYRVEGNGFAYHGDAANAYFAALGPDERRRAVLPEPPNELLVQVQNAAGSFPGVAAGSSPVALEAMAALLDAVLSPFPAESRRDARACIEANGGLAALHVAFYGSRGFYPDMSVWGELAAPERARRGDPYWQVWRIEGPGTVLFFKGYPHVHAYMQIVRDPARSIGESLARTDRMIEGDDMRSLLEAALRRATGEDLAFCAADWPGRLCPGDITTGLAWSVDPFGDRVVVAELEARAMGPDLRARLAAQGFEAGGAETVRIATTDYAVRDETLFGAVDRTDTQRLEMREALVAHLRAGGLEPA